MNKPFKLSLPSKTFFLGEYLALCGGPAILLNTFPRFDITFNYDGTSTIEGIDTDSPAAKFIHEHQSQFKGISIRFNDPHQGQGGFGSSTAQFAGVYLLGHYGDSLCHTILNNPATINEALEYYYQYAWNKHGMRPSGYDLIAQLTGGITFCKNTKLFSKHAWPFTGIDFALIRTDQKIATHEHIANLEFFAIDELHQITSKALTAFNTADANLIIDCVQTYHQALQQLGFVAEYSNILIDELIAQKFILAAKGCGALGADVILVLYPSESNYELKQWLNQKQLKLIATQSQLTEASL